MAERMRRQATESARATVLAAHASVGLAWQVDKNAARLLRTAEALCRTAVAALAALPEVDLAGSGGGGERSDHRELQAHARKEEVWAD